MLGCQSLERISRLQCLNCQPSTTHYVRATLSLQSTQECTAWRLFIMDESNPLVHSTPRAVGIRMRYRNLRFGFLYHTAVSAWAIRCKRGSTCSSFAPMIAMLPLVMSLIGHKSSNADCLSRRLEDMTRRSHSTVNHTVKLGIRKALLISVVLATPDWSMASQAGGVQLSGSIIAMIGQRCSQNKHLPALQPVRWPYPA